MEPNKSITVVNNESVTLLKTEQKSECLNKIGVLRKAEFHLEDDANGATVGQRIITFHTH